MFLPLLALVWLAGSVACAASAGSLKPGATPLTAVAPAPITPATPWDYRDSILYFIFTDRFYDGDPNNNFDVDKQGKGAYHGGDFQGVIDKLDYLSALGVNTIWITPIYDNVDQPMTDVGFPHWPHHGYWPESFDQVDRHLGTEQKLKEVVEKAHQKGIRVFLDVILNHAGYGSTWEKKTDWVRTSQAGTCPPKEPYDPVTDCVSGLPDFKTEKKEVADYLIDVNFKWIERTGCDGFRVDTVKHVDHNVWQSFHSRIKAQYPNFILLGEVFYGNAHDNTLDVYMNGMEFDSCFDFSFPGSVAGFIQNRGSVPAFNNYLTKRDHFKDQMVVTSHLDNHDLEGYLFQLKGDKTLFKLAAALEMTVIGVPLIYYGDEVGRIGGNWPDNRSDMLWGADQDKDMLAYYTKLIHIRTAHKGLSRGKHLPVVNDKNNKDVYVFLRSDAASNDHVLVAFNRSKTEQSVTFPLPASLTGQKNFRDEILGTTQRASAGNLTLKLAPQSVQILIGMGD
jgi:alpha-amylase